MHKIHRMAVKWARSLELAAAAMLRLRHNRAFAGARARLRVLPVQDDELQRCLATPFVEVGPVRGAYGPRQRADVAEQDRVEAFVAPGQRELRVVPADDPLVEHRKGVVEHRSREALSPDLGAEYRGKLDP